MKYKDIYNDIRHKIIRGDYPSYKNIESEEMLCLKYEVSRETLRKAIGKLKDDGYLHSRQGSGIFVNPKEFYLNTSLLTLSERNKDSEVVVESVIIDFEVIRADQVLLDIFNIQEKTSFYHYRRLRKVNGEPYTLEETYMPVKLFKKFDRNALYGSVLEYIENNYGVVVSHDIKKIQAIIPSSEVKKLLNISDNRCLLMQEHKVYLSKNIIAQYTIEIDKNNEITFASVR
ncbi:MAG: GntR family transcriptional regulator [Erysipelotrichaceae bacterium]